MSARVVLAVGVVVIGILVFTLLRRGDNAPVQTAGKEDTSTTAAAEPVSMNVATRAERPVTNGNVALASSEPSTSSTRPTVRPQSIVLYGFVRLPEGASESVDEPWFTVTDSAGTRTSVHATGEGAYSISGLLPGRYKVNAGARPRFETTCVVDLALADTPKRFDITLGTKLSLRVKVVDRAGQPVQKPWLMAVATREPPGEWLDQSPASNPFGLGRFDKNATNGETLAAEYLGRLHLDVAPPLYASLIYNQRVVATQRVECSQEEVEFVVDTGSPLLQNGKIAVRFVDQSGQPVTGAWAMLDGGSSSRQMKPEGNLYSATDLAPGWYRMRPFAKGLEQRILEVLVEPGADKDLGTVTLEPEQWISGKVVASGKTSDRLGLRCDPFSPGGDSDSRYNSINMYGINPDRTFRIPGRSRGLYLMKCDEREGGYGIWARIVDTRAGPVENVQVDLVPGVALVLRPSTDDWQSVTYKIIDEAGVPYVTSRLWGTDPARILLAPGRYQVEARNGSAEPTRKAITIGTQPVELALP